MEKNNEYEYIDDHLSDWAITSFYFDRLVKIANLQRCPAESFDRLISALMIEKEKSKMLKSLEKPTNDHSNQTRP